MHRIDIYRDLGTSVELKDGPNGGEKVIVSPPVDLQDGSTVKVALPTDKKQTEQS
jgi:HlyD family secretion protein